MAADLGGIRVIGRLPDEIGLAATKEVGERAMTSARRTRSSHRRSGTVLLVGSALGVLNALNARRPFSRSGVTGVLSCGPGWLTSELPLHTIAAQALGFIGVARRDALRTTAGAISLVLNAASAAVLVGVDRQARRAGDVFDTAIEQAFGAGLVDGSTADTPTTARRLAAAEPVLLARRRIALGPFTPYRRRYVGRGYNNLAYGDAGRRNRLDIWRRPDLPVNANAPVLLEVHGGGWVLGNKQQQAMPLMAHLCERGWVCVSINYRLSPRATWPDQIIDVKRALAWVKANIARYGGDPNFVAITGGSAGGHLASLAALTPNEPQFQPGFDSADTSVVAAVPFYAAYDFMNRDRTGRPEMTSLLARLVIKRRLSDARNVWDLASPMSWVHPDAPPFLAIHGTNDSLIPVEQARSFVAMLRAVSHNPVAYAELPGAQHAFDFFDSPRTLLTAAGVTRFLETVRGPRTTRS